MRQCSSKWWMISCEKLWKLNFTKWQSSHALIPSVQFYSHPCGDCRVSNLDKMVLLCAINVWFMNVVWGNFDGPEELSVKGMVSVLSLKHIVAWWCHMATQILVGIDLRTLHFLNHGCIYQGLVSWFNISTVCSLWEPTLFIIVTWINNHIPSKVCDETTYLCPFPNFKGYTFEVWKWISNFIPHTIMVVITYPCCDWS